MTIWNDIIFVSDKGIFLRDVRLINQKDYAHNGITLDL